MEKIVTVMRIFYKLSSEEVCSKFTVVFDYFTDTSSLQYVDTSLFSFVSIIEYVCEPLFGKSSDFSCLRLCTTRTVK